MSKWCDWCDFEPELPPSEAELSPTGRAHFMFMAAFVHATEKHPAEVHAQGSFSPDRVRPRGGRSLDDRMRGAR